MKESNTTLTIKIGKKLTSKDFEQLLLKDFNKATKFSEIHFELSNIQWIALEEIIFIFGWIRLSKRNHENISIKIFLPKLNPPQENDEYRRKKQRLLNLWNVWKMWQKCELNVTKETNLDCEINEYIDKTENDSNWHHIVPFTILSAENLEDLNDIREKVEKKLYNRFDLSQQIEDILERHSTLSPFENKALSGIITTELYLNSILHAYSKEETFSECYFAIALRNKIDRNEYIERKKEQGILLTDKEIDNRIEYILKENLKEKSIDEQSFFVNDSLNDTSVNESFLEFSFLDFGCGIPQKLEVSYDSALINDLPLSKSHIKKTKDGDFVIQKDSRILEYSFLLDSSSNPFEKRLEINEYVPRGLFFLIDIVRRYNGLLIARSGKGKIIYNFKHTSIISEAVRFSEYDSKLEYFKGTLISIYLPAINSSNILRKKVEINLENKKKEVSKEKRIIEYLNIHELFKIHKIRLKDKTDKTDLYSGIFQQLNEKIDSFKYKNCTIYIDFSGSENLEIINRKVYFYLCSNPRFDSNTKVIIVHPSNKGELFQAKEAIRFSRLPIYRPIPCFLYNSVTKIQIVWLGISEEEDEELINSSVLSQRHRTYNLDKFINKESILGNVIEIDESDFVKINLENISNILEYYSSSFIYEKIPERFISYYLSNEQTISNLPTILQKNSDYIYWTSGGYYQEEFISLIEILYSYDVVKIGNRGETSDERFGQRVARYLIEKYNYKNDEPLEIDYIITVTLSSQLLGKHIKDMYHRLLHSELTNKREPELIRLANYHEFTLEKAFSKIKENKKVLIVNDVISTGKLNNELHDNLIKLKKAEIVALFTLIDSRDKNCVDVKHYFNKTVDDKTYKLIDYKIPKFKRKDSIAINGDKKVIAIDPVINAPSLMKLERSFGNNVLFFEKKERKNEDFLNLFTKQEHLWVGHFDHNVSHHSYYFKTHELLLSDGGEKLLKEIFAYVTKEEFSSNSDINYVFHPMFSAIETLTNNKLNSILSEYPNFNVFPLPRIDTPKGWRFTFPPKLLNAKGWNISKRNVLIIDDGSCSGDTMLQMIDSVAMIEVDKIVVVSIVARLEDFQREFFSRLNSIKGYKKYMKHEVTTADTWNSISEQYQITIEELLKHNKSSLKPNDVIGIPQTKNNIKEIPLSIYFGTHFHIPVYSPLRHCPFCVEDKTLKDELRSEISSPESVKNYISNRIKELAIYETDGTPINLNCDNYDGKPKYFPLNFNYKKLFLARDIIGKIDTYRLYRDYIKDNFDAIEIDYYLAVILHENRLVDSISHLLPHLKANLIKAIHGQLGIASKDLNSTFSLKWEKVQLIKALYYLKESDFDKIAVMNVVVEGISDYDIDSTNFLTYIYWKKIINSKNTGNILNLINQIGTKFIELSKTERIWDKFKKWILEQQVSPHEDGLSFQYLKDFYTLKKVEYPNHLTTGYEFLSLLRKLKGLQYKVVQAELTFVPESDVKSLSDLFAQAVSKLKDPFLKIIDKKNFKEIIRLCGLYDKFYGENVNANLLINRINKIFNNPVSLREIELIIQNLNTFIDIYLNSKSEFASFFIKHEVNLFDSFEELKGEHLPRLKNENIQYSNKLNQDSFSPVRIHPKCFDIIIIELFNNCIKHTERIKKRYKNNSLSSKMAIQIYAEDKFAHLVYKHNLNLGYEAPIVLNGLGVAKNIIEFFGGSFVYCNQKDSFIVDIKVPFVDRKFEFNQMKKDER